MQKGIKASGMIALAILAFSYEPAYAKYKPATHKDYKIYLKEQSLAVPKINNGIDNDSTKQMCEGYTELMQAMGRWRTDWYSYSYIPPGIKSQYSSEELGAYKLMEEQLEFVAKDIKPTCNAFYKNIEDFNKAIAKAAKVNEKAAARSYAPNSSSFQNYINTNFTWDNGISVKFSRLSSCTFDGIYSDKCTEGYVTINSPVEHKICYLYYVSLDPRDDRISYDVSQCSYK